MKQNVLRQLFMAVLLLCSVSVHAHQYEIDGIYYNILSEDDKTVEVTYYGNDMFHVTNEYHGHITIPENVQIGNVTYKVVAIHDSTFGMCEKVTGVTIPNTIKNIGVGAFGVNEAGGVDFTTVHISDLTSWCNIDFGNYGSNPLSHAECIYVNGELLTEIVIPEGVEEIKQYAFAGCPDVSSISLPKSLKKIGLDAFNRKYTDLHIKSISDWCNIEFDCNPLTSVENFYLNGELVTNLIIPSDVTTIKHHTFNGYEKLSSITIGENVTSIEKLAFGNLPNVSTIIIPENVSDIANDAFDGCLAITKITVDEKNSTYDSRENCQAIIETASNKLVYGCKNSSILNGITAIGSRAFYGQKELVSISLPNTVTSIGDYAFSGTGIDENILTDNITSLGEYAFSGTNIKTVSLPSQVTKVPVGIFSGCTKLFEVNLHNNITNIGANSFRGSSLKSITIPSSVTYIAYDAFNGCLDLKIVYNNSKLIIVAGRSDYGCVAQYANSVITPTDDIQGDFVFRTDVLYSYLIAYLGDEADVVLPESYLGKTYKIYNRVFYKSNIRSITISDNVTDIGSDAFENCDNLTNVVIADGVKTIGSDAFYDCDNLRTITLGKALTTIGNNAFLSCDNLKNVFNRSSLSITTGSTNNGYVAYYAKYVSKNTDDIQGDFVFRTSGSSYTLIAYLGDGNEILLPENYKGKNYSIGGYVFEKLPLSQITIPECVTDILSNAFYGCSKLKTVYNNSALNLSLGTTNYGYIAYYAKAVILKDDNIQGDFVFRTINETPTLVGYLGDEVNVSLPTEYYDGIYAIGDNVFRPHSLTSITIPQGIISIGNYAFYNSPKLTNITIPSSITNIGDYAFQNCSNLKYVENFSSLVLAKGATTHGYITYYATDFFNAPNGSVEGDFVFGVIDGVNTLVKCKLVSNLLEDWTSTNKNNSSTSSHSYSIAAKKGDVLSFDWAVSSEKDYDIFNVILNGKNILSESGNKSGNYKHVFEEEGVFSLVASYRKDESNKSGGDYGKIYNITFSGGNYVDVQLPENYKEENYALGAEIFKSTNVRSVFIPENVVSIGENAFNGCTGLESVTSYITDELFEINTNVFEGIDKTKCILYVIRGYKDVYERTTGWENSFNEIVEITEMNLVDGKDYKNSKDLEGLNITYTRTLPNCLWNPLYVPFEIDVEDIVDKYEVAYINAVHSYDKDDDGEIDELEMEVIKVKAGTTKANYPYLIKARNDEAKAMNISVEGATLYASTENTVDCTSVYQKFEVTGSYSRKSAAELSGKLAISLDGAWQPLVEGSFLNPFRLYLSISNRNDAPLKVNPLALSRVRIVEDGMTTGILDLTPATQKDNVIYDFSGRRVIEPRKGQLYIVNGKKVVY